MKKKGYLKHLLFVVAFLMCGCNNAVDKVPHAIDEKTTDTTKSTAAVKSEVENENLWDNVRSKSLVDVNSYNLDSIDLTSLNKVDSVYYYSLLSNAHLVNRAFPVYNEYEDLYFYEFIDQGKYSLISLLHRDEVCCLSLFYLTVDKSTGKVIDMRVIAIKGVDGNWTERDRGKKLSSNKVQITKIITETEEQNDNSEFAGSSKIIKDSLIVNYTVSNVGIITEAVIDSVRSEKLVDTSNK